jgi:tetratricopeptide (TPR) repeat protein
MVATLFGAGALAWFTSAAREERAALRLLRLGRPAEAEPLLRRTLASLERHYGKRNWRVALALGNVSYALLQQRRVDDADAVMTRALALIDREAPPHPRVGFVWFHAARLRIAQARYAEALELLRHARRGSPEPAIIACAALYAHLAMNDIASAVGVVAELDLRDASTVTLVARVGGAALASGNAAGARDCFRRAVEHAQRHAPGSHTEAFYRGRRAEALVRLGAHAEAKADLDWIVAFCDRSAGGQAIVLEPLLLLATTLLALHDRNAARAACSRVLALAHRHAPSAPYRDGAPEAPDLARARARATDLLAAIDRDETLAERASA